MENAGISDMQSCIVSGNVSSYEYTNLNRPTRMWNVCRQEHRKPLGNTWCRVFHSGVFSTPSCYTANFISITSFTTLCHGNCQIQVFDVSTAINTASRRSIGALGVRTPQFMALWCPPIGPLSRQLSQPPAAKILLSHRDAKIEAWPPIICEKN